MTFPENDTEFTEEPITEVKKESNGTRAISCNGKDVAILPVLNDLGTVMGWAARIAVIDTDGDEPRPIMHDGKGATASLAICAAALRARS